MKVRQTKQRKRSKIEIHSSYEAFNLMFFPEFHILKTQSKILIDIDL